MVVGGDVAGVGAASLARRMAAAGEPASQRLLL